MTENQADPIEAPRKRGRPRKLPEVRESAAEAPRVRSGRAVAIGRDGRQLTRKLSGTLDKFDLKALGITPPDGWTYEFKRKTIAGMEDVDHLNSLAENGWTAVPADRHATNFNFKSKTGEIVRDGLLLMERPATLTQEAREEERAIARDQVRAQHDQYRARLPSGMSGDHPSARAQIKTSYEQASPDLRPSYQISPER